MKIQQPDDKKASFSHNGESFTPDENGVIELQNDIELLEVAKSHGFVLVDGAEPDPAENKPLTVGQVKAGITAETDLDALEAAEKDGLNRVGVFEAIQVERNKRAADPANNQSPASNPATE